MNPNQQTTENEKIIEPTFDYPDLTEVKGLRKLVIKIMHAILFFIYRIEFEGVENIPDKGPLLITSNHVTFVDPFLIMIKPKFWVYWVSKRENLYNPLAHIFLKWWRVIPVARNKVDLNTAKMMLKCLQENRIIGIFPEATRVRPGYDLKKYPPRNGVVRFSVRHQVPILPVAIQGSMRWFSKVKVIYGKPYILDVDNKEARHQIDYLANDIMRRIYALQDMDYPSVEEQKRD